MQPNPDPKPDFPIPLRRVQTWPYPEALPIAQKYLTMFEPLCHLAAIAGSIRRKRTYVKDIEIVCVPHQVEVYEQRFKPLPPMNDLFSEQQISEPEPPLKVIGYQPKQEFIDMVNSWEKVKGDPTGRYTQRILPDRMTLDLFIVVNEIDFYRQFAMRTGSADFSKNVISRQWVKNGWRGTSDGLRRDSECVFKNDKYICMAEKPTLPPIWKSEEEFFNWLGLEWCPPEHRY